MGSGGGEGGLIRSGCLFYQTKVRITSFSFPTGAMTKHCSTK